MAPGPCAEDQCLAHAVQHGGEREGVGERGQPVGQAADREPGTREEQQGQVGGVGEGRGRIGVGHQAGVGDAEGGEGGRAEQCDQREGDPGDGRRWQADVEQQPAQAEHQHGLHGDQDQPGDDLATEERPWRQGRAPQPLELAVVAHDRQPDHQADEGAGHDGHAEHAGGEEGGVADLGAVRVELHGAVAVDGAEEHQEHHRQQDGEEGARAVAPERPEHVAALAGRQHQRVHAASSLSLVRAR